MSEGIKRVEENDAQKQKKTGSIKSKVTIFSGKELERILKCSEELIQAAKPFMERLYSFIEDSDFLVSLTDRNGIILDVVGDSTVISQKFMDIGFVPGCYVGVEAFGNTAVYTALHERRPLQIDGEEHINEELKSLGGSAVPIMEDSKAIGTLCITGPCEKTHPHTLGMAVAAAYAIEVQIKVQRANRELRLKNQLQSIIVESVSEGLLTLDRDGFCTFLNQIGADILNIDQKNSIGKHIKTLINYEPLLPEALETGKGYVDRELIIKTKNGVVMHLVMTSVPIRDENGGVAGVVDTFRKIKGVTKMVNDMVGAYANFTFDDIFGSNSDPEFRECIRMAKIAAKSSSNVLIQGESGTGKELFAHAIHSASSRANQPFITVNCAAIPRELIESELFGYHGGAFTGALKNGRRGKFEMANGGTIFLDEIGDMPLDMQVKLLRVIQDRQITRIGGNDVFKIDVRIISATNRHLLEECEAGNFRRDLYYRLNVLNIETVPLRHRINWIRELVGQLIQKINLKLEKRVTGIDEQAMECLFQYNWPGNVRELENTLERAINICEEGEIGIQELPANMFPRPKKYPKDVAQIEEDLEKPERLENLMTLEEVEHIQIQKVLLAVNGNISKSSEILGITRNTLYNKMKKYEITANER